MKGTPPHHELAGSTVWYPPFISDFSQKSIYGIDISHLTLYTVFTVFFELFAEFGCWWLRSCFILFFWRSTPITGVLRLFLLQKRFSIPERKEMDGMSG